MVTRSTASDAVIITVVHSPACHFCDDARQALGEPAREFPLTVELLACTAPPGTALMCEHHAGIYPLVLVDGAFFSAGRLPRKKLRMLLTVRAAAGRDGQQPAGHRVDPRRVLRRRGGAVRAVLHRLLRPVVPGGGREEPAVAAAAAEPSCSPPGSPSCWSRSCSG